MDTTTLDDSIKAIMIQKPIQLKTHIVYMLLYNVKCKLSFLRISILFLDFEIENFSQRPLSRGVLKGN